MIVGFFSDDGSALYAALLASCGLACVNRCMPVVERPSCNPSIKDAASSRTELVAALAMARADGRRDVAFVAPLDLLHHDAVAHLDVAVVSGGDPLQARRAKRAAGYASDDLVVPGTGCRDPGKPWSLPFGAWRRHVRGAPVGPWPHGRSIAPAARTLPVKVPLPGRSVKAAMERGLPTLETLRVGLLLAATLEVAASDREAAAIEPATMADLMSPASHPADQALAERLGELAERLEDIERTLASGTAPSPFIRRGWVGQRRRDGRPGGTAVPEWAQASRLKGDVFTCGS